MQYIARAKQCCDRLLVAVNSDDSIRRYKSPLRPINPQDERMYVIAGLADVDVVTILEEDRPLSLLLRWKPDLYIKGGDYAASSLRSGKAVEEYGGEVVVIPPEFRTSTSGVIERIAGVLRHSEPDRLPAGAVRGLVLLDRDGTLIRDVPFCDDPAQVELLPGVGEGLAALQAAGFALAIVTNQQGIGLGYYTTRQMIAVNQQLFRALAPYGVRIAKIYFCPHTAADGCGCRKPKGGLIRRALREFETTAGRTFLIGDTAADRGAGQTEGCRTILVGGETDFAAAVRQILSVE